MNTNRSIRTWAARGLLAAVAMGAGVAAGLANRAEAFPFPSPVYDILTTSGTHQGSLLNLGLGQPGVPQVPHPVDVDGDLLPDITVAVNLVDLNGAINNPPDVGEILVPNVEINRILTGTLLGQPLPPLRVEVRLRLMDVGGDAPDTTIRFGYETGPGGSIPPAFKARLGGLENFFNPLVATVDTGPSAGRPTTYEGPLRLVGGIDSGDSHVDLGLGFAPLPSTLEVSYASDDAGQHITYAHSVPREVDARADIDFVDGDGELHVDARIDRLPSSIAVDIAEGGSDDGAIDWRSNSDGRRPDVDVHVESIGSGDDDEPLYADIDLESIPPEIGAVWSLPTDGPIDVAFTTGDDDRGLGVGGVDVDIRNHAPTHPDAIASYVPTEQQYLSVAQEAAGDGSVLRRISGRVERVRSVSFSDADGVMNADVSMGDGEQPLEVSYDCRVECSEDGATRLVDVDTTVSPLPDNFSVGITDAGDDPRVAPMLIDYTASQPADVEASIHMAQEGSTGADITCGAARTMCADVEVRDLPSELHARLGQYASDHDEGEVPEEADLRLAVDLGDDDPGTPHLAPDLDATVILGPENPNERPLVADAQALGLPQHTRVYLHQHRESTDEGDALALDRAAFHACDRAVDADVCTGIPGEIGAITVSLRTFLERPVGFPVPLHDRPQYASVHGRPTGLEVGARVEHVRDLEYVNTGPLQGVFASAGDGVTPFTARIDLQDLPGDDIILGPDENGDNQTLTGVTSDLRADADVSILPPSFGVCFRTPNENLIEADKAFTEACENSELDGDPLAFAYALDVEEDDTIEVVGTFATTVAGTVDGGILDGDDYSETMEGEATVPDVPDSVIVQASLPEEDTVGPVDAVYDASDTLDIDFAARMFLNDSRCLDPRADASAMCVEAYLDDIPSFATVHYDPTDSDDNLAVHTEYPPDLSLAARMDLDDVRLTSVTPRAEPIDEPVPTPSVLIVEGDIINLPTDVHGTIVTPDDDGDDNIATQPAKTIVICASAQPCSANAIAGEIERVTVRARNVVVADPTPLGGSGDLTPQRQGLPEPTDEVTAYQRGGAFHALIDLGHISNVGYRQVAGPSPERRRLETDELQLGFGPGAGLDQVIRAFVDLDAGTSRTIADVTLEDVPEQTTFCFRGADLSPGVDPPEAERTFCDTAPTEDEGAVQVDTVPRAGSDGLDVDAFVRQTSGGDATGIVARIVAGNIPARVEGTIPAEGRGSLDIAGFDVDDAPDGFDALRFEIANFDLVDTGYPAGDEPWTRTIGKPSADFPAPPFVGQHLSVVATDSGFHARGQVDGLRRIALRDGLCAPMAGPDGEGDVRDDYPFYPDPVPGTQPYTCVRTEFDEQGAGEDLDLRAFIRGEDGDVLSLTEAGIDRLPSVMQMTMADISPLNDDQFETLREPCATYESGLGDDDCLPPMIRVDVEAADPSNPPEVFGVLQIGSEEHLIELGETEARGNPIENATFDGTIDSMPALGANVKVGTWTATEGYIEEVEEGTAVIARLRLTLPYSLSVDPPQTWSDTQPNAETPDFRATDLRMHYVARSGPNTVVESLGELRLLVHSEPDNTQTLVSGGGVDGLNIPGELAVAVYLRDDVAEKRMFAQVDGAVSDEVNLVASILGATPPTDPLNLPDDYEPPIDRMTFEIRNMPEGPFGGWEDPFFRIQAEVIDDSPPPEDCSTTSCSISESRLREVRGLLDFHPAGSDTGPARLIKAVVRTLEDGPLGIQVAGFTTLDPDLTNEFGEGNAEITLAGELTIDPMYAYSFEGVPFLANFEVEVDTSLHVGISVENATDFQLFSNQLGIVTNYDGTGHAIVGPLDLRPETLYVDVTFLGATVFGLDLSPVYDQDEPLGLDFFSCDGGDIAASILLGDFAYRATDLLNNLPWEDGPISFDVGQGRTDTVIFPQINLENMIPAGPGGFLADAFPSLRQAIGCAMFDQDEVDLITDANPGVSQLIDGHTVPGSSVTIDDPPEVQQPPDADLLVELGDEVMCGRNIYQGTVRIIGDISVATDNDAITAGTCLDGFEGSLEITADYIEVEPGASIGADAVVSSSCTSPFGTSSTYNFTGAHEPDPGGQFNQANPIHPNFGQCDAYFASGSGAGHIGNGGAPVLSPIIHTGYDGTSLTRNDPGIVTAGFQGGGGSGVGGGAGGGVIRLVADRVTLGGRLSAEGGSGNAAPVDDPGDPCASTPTFGGGGGSGGGIAVAANRIDIESGAELAARGGAGGAGVFGGGGGAGGDVELLAGIIATAGEVEPTANFSLAAGGGGGDSACGDPLDGTSGSFGAERAEERPQSSVLPLGNGPGGLWWTNNDVDGDGAGEVVHVPVVAAASDPSWSGANDTGVTIALCGVPLTPETPDAEGGFRVQTPNIPNSGNLCGLKTFGDDLASQVFAYPSAVMLGHTYVENDNDVTPEDGITIPVAGFDATAYVGLYTIAVRSDFAGNDCFDGDLFDFTCFGVSGLDPANDCDDPFDWVGLDQPWSFGSFYYDSFWNIFQQNPGLEYDYDVCVYDNLETPPGQLGPDLVIGIDNDAPDPDDITIEFDPYDAAQIDGDNMWNNLGWIEGSVTGNDRVQGTGVLDLSGIDRFECFQRDDQGDHHFPCDLESGFEASVRGGEGRKTIGVTAIDRVGNRTTILDDRIVIDTTVPDSVLTRLSSPDRANDWYSTSPQLQLSGFPDPAPDSLQAPPHPDHRYVYQIDDGPEIDCEDDANPSAELCLIDGTSPLVLPGDGMHRVWYTAVDRAGNRNERCDECVLNFHPMAFLDIGVDNAAPLADNFAAPFEPDGTHGWYRTRPWIGVGFNDPPVGGSGIRLDRDPSVLEVERIGLGDPIGFNDYDEPFQLGAGTHLVTARARDDAGNPWLLPPAVGPTRTYRVDPSAPAVTLAVAGPLGTNGWYTGPATVTVGTFDLPVLGASGVNPLFAGSGLFVSVDGGPFVPFTPGPVVLGEGEHVVRAYAVDVAGNHSPVAERFVDVDRSHPVSVLRTVPADPARAPWFRTRPAVVLRATDGDANAGVTTVRYCFGTGCIPSVIYTGPFTPAAGTTVLRWQALDASGAANHEPIRQATLRSDETPPVPVAKDANKLIWLRLLGPSTIQLRFTVSDNFQGPLQATVVIYDVLGNPVRRINAAPITVNAGQVVNGSVSWDGRVDGLGALVPLGVYHYRVVLTDQAGNIAQSGESKPITIRLL